MVNRVRAMSGRGSSGDGPSKPDFWRRSGLAGVAALTVGAFAIRLAELDQSLWGDELYTYRIVTENTVWGVFRDVAHTTELTPPLHYLFAWLGVQVGDPTITVRLPSLILGTATVPLVYALGLQTVGRAAGLVGAALVAMAPFAIYYSVESRAYGTLICLSALSTLLLLRALRHGGPVSWVAFGMSTAAVLYTHYTGVFVVLGQLGWALWTHRDRVTQLAFVHVAVGLAYAPWLPSFLDQRSRSSGQTERFAREFPLEARRIPHTVTAVLPGYPPGGTWVAIFWATIGVAIVGVALGVLGRRRAGTHQAGPPRMTALIVVLALVTPLGVVLYSVQPHASLLLSRNLGASLPAFALLVGWLLTSLRPWFAMPAVAVAVAAVGVGAVETLDHDNQRPPYREVAHYLDHVAGPDDVILTGQPDYVRLYLRRRFLPENDPSVWERAAHGGRVFVAHLELVPTIGLPRLAGPNNRVPLRGERRFAGSFPLVVGRYTGRLEGRLRRRNGQLVIDWSLGHDIQVTPKATRGAVDSVSMSAAVLNIAGWATDGVGQAGAEAVLAFSGRRLLAAGWPTAPRPDVAKAYGSRAILSGYALTVPITRSHDLPSRLRVFALVRSRASELEPTPRAHDAIRRGASKGRMTTRPSIASR